MEADLDEPDHVPLGGDVTGHWDNLWTPAIEGRSSKSGPRSRSEMGVLELIQFKDSDNS